MNHHSSKTDFLKALEDNFSPQALSLMKLLSLLKKKYYSLEDYIEHIEPDIGLCAKVLKLANSPAHGIPTEISSIAQAVTYLGENLIFNLVLSNSLRSIVPSDCAKYYDQNFYSAVVARSMAKLLGLDCELVFTITLLKDLGQMMMLSFCPYIYISEKQSCLLSCDSLCFEQNKFSVDHIEVGCHFLKAWKLPDMFADITRLHHDPVEKRKPEDSIHSILQVIRLADLYVLYKNESKDFFYFHFKKDFLLFMPDESFLKDLIEEVNLSVKNYEDFFSSSDIDDVEPAAIEDMIVLEQSEKIACYEQMIRELTDFRKSSLQSEKVTQLHHVLDGIYHEINNPLAIHFQHMQLLEARWKKKTIKQGDLHKLFQLGEVTRFRISYYLNLMMKLSSIHFSEFKEMELAPFVDRIKQAVYTSELQPWMKEHFLQILLPRQELLSNARIVGNPEQFADMLILVASSVFHVIEKMLPVKKKNMLQISIERGAKSFLVKLRHQTAFIPHQGLTQWQTDSRFLQLHEKVEMNLAAGLIVLQEFYGGKLMTVNNQAGGKNILLDIPLSN